MELLTKILNKKAKIGIIGLGYVGLPLGLEFANQQFQVLGFDLEERKIDLINKGDSYIKHISAEKIKQVSQYFSATNDFARITELDIIIIAVPTPLDEHREPDISFISNSAKTIAKYLKKGQLVVLESSTYPGTTEEVLLPLFENAPIIQFNTIQVNELATEMNQFKKNNPLPFKVGIDFYLAFSPEREDPNNQFYKTSTIPKVIGGQTEKCLQLTKTLYDQVIIKTVPVSSTKTAEATKLLENIYRSINIALVNELKMVFERMNIDIWEVIEAAKTKPFGFQAFYPGPGLGGHCIPIDPFYLTWKAREYEINTKFIELAGEINTYMPYYVVDKTMQVLNCYKKAINGSKILILGASYKKDIDDMRESPSLKLIEIFIEKGAIVDYNDPYVLVLPKTRKCNFELKSVEITKENLKSYDIIILSTDHSIYNYQMISENAQIIIDTRNVFKRNNIVSLNIFKA